MKKVFKKNQLIITALALMIAVAGYLSFTDKNGKDERVAMESSLRIRQIYLMRYRQRMT
ncbi:MAG: SpoIIIAH-like family protein [Roseburia sp.]